MATRCPRVQPSVPPADAQAARNRPRVVVHDSAYAPRIGVELAIGRGWRGKDLRVSLGRRVLIFFVGHHPDCPCDDCMPF